MSDLLGTVVIVAIIAMGLIAGMQWEKFATGMTTRRKARSAVFATIVLAGVLQATRFLLGTIDGILAVISVGVMAILALAAMRWAEVMIDRRAVKESTE